jgi:hypothetical protein
MAAHVHCLIDDAEGCLVRVWVHRALHTRGCKDPQKNINC